MGDLFWVFMGGRGFILGGCGWRWIYFGWRWMVLGLFSVVVSGGGWW